MSGTEEFIEKVRGYPILYDLKHSEYKNIKKKDKIWDEIAVSIGGVTGDQLKKKWKNLRDSYAKFLRSEKTKTGQEMKSLDRYKTWPWAEQMEFVRHSLSFANTHSNLSSVCQPVSPLPAETNEQLHSSHMDEQNDTPVQRSSVAKNSQPQPSEHSSVVENSHPITADSAQQRKKTRQLRPKKKKPNNPKSSAVEQVISYLDRTKDQATSDDDIDDIFKGYVKTIKKFSKKRQAIVKFKISELIMDQELEHLDEEEQHVHNITASTSVDRPNSAQSSTASTYLSRPHSADSSAASTSLNRPHSAKSSTASAYLSTPHSEQSPLPSSYSSPQHVDLDPSPNISEVNTSHSTQMYEHFGSSLDNF